jgi:hypothetical protein
MPAPAQINNSWVDIVPPGVPVHSIAPWAIVLAVSILVALIALGIFFYYRPCQRAKRALRKLAHAVQGSQVEIKPACFRIRQYLAEGFEQHQLQSVQLGHAHHMQWQNFLNRLSQYCFAAQPPGTAELNGIIAEALDWLNKKPVDTK